VTTCPRCGARLDDRDAVEEEVANIEKWAAANRVRLVMGNRLRRCDVADYIGRSERTIRSWESAGTGPRITRVGGSAYYRVRDLAQFLADAGRSGQLAS